MVLASTEADRMSRRLTGNKSSRGDKGDRRLFKSSWCHDPTDGHCSHFVPVMLAARLRLPVGELAPTPERSAAPAFLNADPFAPWRKVVVPSIYSGNSNLLRNLRRLATHRVSYKYAIFTDIAMHTF